MNIQKHCEVLDKLLDKAIKDQKALTFEEFVALNTVLGYAQIEGAYKIEEEVVH